MTTATMTAPPITAAPRLRRPATGPRLLLPPVPEPTGAAPPAAPLIARPEPTSLLSPPVGRGWPAAPHPAPPRADPPDPRRLCGAVVLAAVEALRCTRPLTQLVRWLTPEVFEAVARAVHPPDETPRGPRPVIRSAHVCRVSPTVAEGAVVVHDGPRVRAAALRMEVRRGSWRVTALQIG